MSCSMTSKFFYAERPCNPLTRPEDVIPYLAKKDKHWKKGCSAYELTHSWMTANGIPDAVRTVLDQADEFRCMELIKGFFEKRTHLQSRGTPSQTDLLALIGDGAVSAVLGIEGKVEESFGPLVSKWCDASENKQIRLGKLRETLGLMSTDVCKLRYQLIHRTAAAVYEAQCHNVQQAVMLVHSFSEKHYGFNYFQAFAEAIKAPVSNINELSCEVEVESISLRLGWVADTVAS